MDAVGPAIAVQNRQRRVRLDLAWLNRFARIALDECGKAPSQRNAGIAGLGEIGVTIVPDQVIAEMHEKFMNVLGPTDVITFDHGEVIIGAETARENAHRFRREVMDEIGLYIVHGLLHLQGYDDREPVDAERMNRLQQKIHRRCCRKLRSAGSCR